MSEQEGIAGQQPGLEPKTYEIKPEQVAELTRRFTYHPPKNTQFMRYEVIRQDGRLLAMTLLRLTPASREQSLALTALEEAIMWANAAIARNE